MADEIPPSGTPPQPASPTLPQATRASAAPAYDEFSSAKRNLPPMLPVVIAIVLVAVVVGMLAYINRAKPVAQGSIDGVYFSQPGNMSSPMILIEVTLRNTSDKTVYIKDIKGAVVTDQGEQSDQAAAARDYDRYLTAYPDLQGHARPLEVEMTIKPGAALKGTVLISPSVTKAQFDGRKDTTVTVQPYDQRPIVLHENAATAK